jgi:hydrogenase expression/formation protein HypD
MISDELKKRVSQLKKGIETQAAKLDMPLSLMEVCGTHTVALFRQGIRDLLPEGIRLLSGPGCPVCVTSIEDVETAMSIARTEGVVLTTFGDMMRVPGANECLFDAKAAGADVRIVYGPADALKLAKEEPTKKVVFFATGFETTSPLVAATVMMAQNEGIENFYIYAVHKLVPPALEALMSAGDININGLILPGHACSITGTGPFMFVAEKYGVASTVTGFEAVEILEGIFMILNQLVDKKPTVDIQYRSIVKHEGNQAAVAAINEVYTPADAYWRGIGEIPLSGLKLNEKYKKFDILGAIGPLEIRRGQEPPGCSCGDVLKGKKLPPECKLFGKACTPDRPVGACMVSAEGSCAAYYKYGGHG